MGEKILHGLDESLDEGSSIHVLDEHLGFEGSPLSMFDFDFLDGGGKN